MPDSPASPSSSPSARANAGTDLGLLVFLGAVWGAVFLFMRDRRPRGRRGLGRGDRGSRSPRCSWSSSRAAGPGEPRGAASLDFLVTGATFSAIPFTLIAFATLTLPVGVGALLNAATPLFTAMIGVAVLGQRLTGRVVAGIAIGMGAVALVVGWSPLDLGPGTLLAVGAALGAAFSYGVAGTFVRRRLSGIPGHRDRDRPARVGLDRPAPVRHPVRPARRAVRRRRRVACSRWPSSRPRSPGRCTSGCSSGRRATAASTVTFIVPAFAILWGAIALGEPIGPELVVGFGADHRQPRAGPGGPGGSLARSANLGRPPRARGAAAG